MRLEIEWIIAGLEFFLLIMLVPATFLSFLPGWKGCPALFQKTWMGILLSISFGWLALVMHHLFIGSEAAVALARSRGNIDYDGTAMGALVSILGWLIILVYGVLPILGIQLMVWLGGLAYRKFRSNPAKAEEKQVTG